MKTAGKPYVFTLTNSRGQHSAFHYATYAEAHSRARVNGHAPVYYINPNGTRLLVEHIEGQEQWTAEDAADDMDREWARASA